jgi:hypothetical protein
VHLEVVVLVVLVTHYDKFVIAYDDSPKLRTSQYARLHDALYSEACNIVIC